MNNSFDHTLKILVIGDSGIGKSCLIKKYSTNIFDEATSTTVGIDFSVKMFRFDDKLVKVLIWDTAGQEKFRTVATPTYRNTNGIMLVYDTTNIKTFENIKTWFDETKLYCDKVDMILVGNKTDLSAKITTEMGQLLAKDLGIPFIETSPKTGLNVQYCFDKLIVTCVTNNNVQKEDSKRVNLEVEKPDKVSWIDSHCCFK